MEGRAPIAVELNLKLPGDLHRRLVRAATGAHPASLNFEIVKRLYASLEKPASVEDVASQLESAAWVSI